MSDKRLQELRDVYRPGVRVELTGLGGLQGPPAGARGTVRGVDDAGAVLLELDAGGTASCPRARCRILVGEFTGRVRDQILAIRASGETNMFDIPAVQAIANREGYHDLILYLIDHKREYADFILRGEP